MLLQCIGDPLRGDDGLGPQVAELLQQQDLPPGLRIRIHCGEGTELMQEWAAEDRVILVDAARSGAAPGRLYHLDLRRQAAPADLRCCSSHAFGPLQAVELARSLNLLPARIELYAVEAAGFELGAPLSAPVRRAAAGLAARLLARLR